MILRSFDIIIYINAREQIFRGCISETTTVFPNYLKLFFSIIDFVLLSYYCFLRKIKDDCHYLISFYRLIHLFIKISTKFNQGLNGAERRTLIALPLGLINPPATSKPSKSISFLTCIEFVDRCLQQMLSQREIVSLVKTDNEVYCTDSNKIGDMYSITFFSYKWWLKIRKEM